MNDSFENGKSEDNEQSNAYSHDSHPKPLYYERPDGSRVFYRSGPTLEAPIGEDAERDFNTSIFDDVNLAPPKFESDSPSNFVPLTDEDYAEIMFGYRKAAEKHAASSGGKGGFGGGGCACACACACAGGGRAGCSQKDVMQIPE